MINMSSVAESQRSFLQVLFYVQHFSTSLITMLLSIKTTEYRSSDLVEGFFCSNEFSIWLLVLDCQTGRTICKCQEGPTFLRTCSIRNFLIEKFNLRTNRKTDGQTAWKNGHNKAFFSQKILKYNVVTTRILPTCFENKQSKNKRQ